MDSLEVDLMPKLLREREASGRLGGDLDPILEARGAVSALLQVPHARDPQVYTSVGELFFAHDGEGAYVQAMDVQKSLLGLERPGNRGVWDQAGVEGGGSEEIDVELGRSSEPLMRSHGSVGACVVWVGFPATPDNLQLHSLVVPRRAHAILRAYFDQDRIVIKGASLAPRGRMASNNLRVRFSYVSA